MLRLISGLRAVGRRSSVGGSRRRASKPARRRNSRSTVLRIERLEERLALDGETTLNASGCTIEESAGVAEFSVMLMWPAADTVTVHYETRDGTAVSGADYTSASGDLTFAPGELEKTVSVAILDDSDPEYDEEFYLDLSNAMNANIDMGEAVATILQNDPPLVFDTIQSEEVVQGSQFYCVATANDPGDPQATFAYSLAEGAPDGMTIDDATGEISWTPTQQNGLGLFDVTVVATDVATPARTASQSFTITVDEPPNTAPTTNGIVDVYVNEDDPDTVIDLHMAFDDEQDTDAQLTYAVTMNNAPQLFSGVTIDSQTGELRLEYAPDAWGTAAITVQATDSGGLSVETSFMVEIAAVDDAPVISDFAVVWRAESTGLFPVS